MISSRGPALDISSVHRVLPQEQCPKSLYREPHSLLLAHTCAPGLMRVGCHRGHLDGAGVTGCRLHPSTTCMCSSVFWRWLRGWELDPSTQQEELQGVSQGRPRPGFQLRVIRGNQGWQALRDDGGEGLCGRPPQRLVVDCVPNLQVGGGGRIGRKWYANDTPCGKTNSPSRFPPARPGQCQQSNQELH